MPNAKKNFQVRWCNWELATRLLNTWVMSRSGIKSAVTDSIWKVNKQWNDWTFQRFLSRQDYFKQTFLSVYLWVINFINVTQQHRKLGFIDCIFEWSQFHFYSCLVWFLWSWSWYFCFQSDRIPRKWWVNWVDDMQDLYELERKLVENGADMKGLKVVPAVVDEEGHVVYLGNSPSMIRNIISCRRQLTQRTKK